MAESLSSHTTIVKELKLLESDLDSKKAKEKVGKIKELAENFKNEQD